MGILKLRSRHPQRALNYSGLARAPRKLCSNRGGVHKKGMIWLERLWGMATSLLADQMFLRRVPLSRNFYSQMPAYARRLHLDLKIWRLVQMQAARNCLLAYRNTAPKGIA